MDLEQKIRFIEYNHKVGAYTIVAKECVGIIEQALRQFFIGQLTRLDEKDRLRVQEQELKKGKGQQGIAHFTMGQLVHLFRESDFLAAWERASKKDLSNVRMINLDELTKIRNNLIHNDFEATRSEAEFLFHCLKIILETFELANVDAIEKSIHAEKDDSKLIHIEDHPLSIEQLQYFQNGRLSERTESPHVTLQLAESFVSSEVTHTPRLGQVIIHEPGISSKRFMIFMPLLQTIVIGLGVFLIFLFPYTQRVELKTSDWKFQTAQTYYKMEKKGIAIQKNKIILITLYNDFLDGNIISREKLSHLITFLAEQHPKVIGIDILFDKSADGDDRLIEAIKAANNVIIPYEIKANSLENRPEILSLLPEFQEVARVGFANFRQDPIDHVIRRLEPLELAHDNTLHYPFALQILCHYYGRENIKDILHNNPQKTASLRINFNSDNQFVLLQPEDLEKEAFKELYYQDKIVLIGYCGDKQPDDMFLTPLSRQGAKMKGVLVHVNILQTVLSEQYIRNSRILDLSLALGGSLIGRYLLLKLKWIVKLLLLCMLWACYIGMILCLFIFMKMDISLWPPMLTLTVTTFLRAHKLS